MNSRWVVGVERGEARGRRPAASSGHLLAAVASMLSAQKMADTQFINQLPSTPHIIMRAGERKGERAGMRRLPFIFERLLVQCSAFLVFSNHRSYLGTIN